MRLTALADRALFWAFAAAWGLGLALAFGRLPPLEPRAENPAWVERYGSLRPLVVGADRAYFVHDFARPVPHRFHRAQFELAPCALEARSSVASVPVVELLERPLILDFHLADRWAEALGHLERAAARRRLELVVTKLPGTLAATVRVRAAS